MKLEEKKLNIIVEKNQSEMKGIIYYTFWVCDTKTGYRYPLRVDYNFKDIITDLMNKHFDIK